MLSTVFEGTRPHDLVSPGGAVRVVDVAFGAALVGAVWLAVTRGFPPLVLGGLAVGIVGVEYLVSKTVTDDIVRTLGTDGVSADGTVTDEAAESRVRELVREVSAGLGIDPPRVAVVDDRGLVVADGSDQRVVLVPGHLVQTLDDGPLRGVLAHELAHVSLGHLRRVPLRETASTVVGCAVCWTVVLGGLSPPVALALGTGYLLAALSRGSRGNWAVYVVGGLGVPLVLDALAAYANRLEELCADDLAVAETSAADFSTGLYLVGTTTGGGGGVTGSAPFDGPRSPLQRLTAPYPTVEARLDRFGVSPESLEPSTTGD